MSMFDEWWGNSGPKKVYSNIAQANAEAVLRRNKIPDEKKTFKAGDRPKEEIDRLIQEIHAENEKYPG